MAIQMKFPMAIVMRIKPVSARAIFFATAKVGEI
jgi:hypothetical protein